MGNSFNIIHLVKKSLVSIFEKEKGRKASYREIAELYDIVDKVVSESNEVDDSGYNEGMEKSYKYIPHYKRNRNRKTIIWHFLDFLKAYRELCNGTQDFYDYKKFNEEFIWAKGELRKLQPSDDDVLIFIRYCQREYYYGLCDIKISTNEITLIQNWRELAINHEEAFPKTLAHYIEYWDDVLNSYVQKSAKIKRIHY
ncbi:MAG: hypothetical protein ACOYJF_10690, partial [Prevotella sp.]